MGCVTASCCDRREPTELLSCYTSVASIPGGSSKTLVFASLLFGKKTCRSKQLLFCHLSSSSKCMACHMQQDYRHTRTGRRDRFIKQQGYCYPAATITSWYQSRAQQGPSTSTSRLAGRGHPYPHQCNAGKPNQPPARRTAKISTWLHARSQLS